MLKMYGELADWWPLISPLEDYKAEAEFFLDVLSETGLPHTPSLLELGCGGGNNAFYLKNTFGQVMLTDLSPHMLAISRTLNPECEHVEGDMRTLRLGRLFDVVFIHDAIEYMTTSQELVLALETAYVHCKPGGTALFVPDHVRENFQPATEHGGGDGQGRAMRYLEWTYDPDDQDTMYTLAYLYMFRSGDQPTWVEHEQHICGLFSRSEWLGMLEEVGFRPAVVQDPYKRDIFVGHRPSG